MKRNSFLHRSTLAALLAALALPIPRLPAATIDGSQGIDLGSNAAGYIYNGKAISLWLGFHCLQRSKRSGFLMSLLGGCPSKSKRQ